MSTSPRLRSLEFRIIIIILPMIKTYCTVYFSRKDLKKSPQGLLPHQGKKKTHSNYSHPTWVLSAAAITMPSAGIPRAQISTTNLVSWILGAENPWVPHGQNDAKSHGFPFGKWSTNAGFSISMLVDLRVSTCCVAVLPQDAGSEFVFFYTTS